MNYSEKTRTQLSRGDMFALRLVDIFLASIGILILTPIFISILILTWIDTRSPFFRQERIGLHKTQFKLIKFRTMQKGTPSVVTHLASSEAITKVGSFLRRCKLDELPQLWNVLIGDMSLVGPRPGLPSHSELTKIRNEFNIFSVRPGITGLAQISGIDMSTPELLAKTDAEMMSTMSFYNYFKYIILTVYGKGWGDRIKN